MNNSGASANSKTLDRGQFAKMVSGLRRPDYPPMPSHNEPVPMPARKS